MSWASNTLYFTEICHIISQKQELYIPVSILHEAVWPWACHLTFLVSSTHFLNARPSHSLVLWFFFVFLGFMILLNSA